MTKTAIGLFKSSATADAVVALLLASGFSRDEVKLVKRSDFDARRSPETDILKLGGVPAEHAGRYWDAVRESPALKMFLDLSAGQSRNSSTEPKFRLLSCYKPVRLCEFEIKTGTQYAGVFVGIGFAHQIDQIMKPQGLMGRALQAGRADRRLER